MRTNNKKVRSFVATALLSASGGLCRERHRVALLQLLIATYPSMVFACPFCNLDGPATRNFLLMVMGSAILGFVLFLAWSWTAGHFQNVEKPKHRILLIDQKTKVKR